MSCGGNFQGAFCFFLSFDIHEVAGVVGAAHLAGFRGGERRVACGVADEFCEGLRGRIRGVAPTHAASGPHISGQIRLHPRAPAANAEGKAPATPTNVPSRDSSPIASIFSAASSGINPVAAKSAMAMGKSKCDPALGRSAGDRLMVIFFDGSAICIAARAARTRSRASETALSGRPTMVKLGKPGETAH